MAISFEQFFRSIAIQESGGRYDAVGVPTAYGRAYGKYQVLAPNVGPWTQKYYGRRLTPEQFLRNPAAQEAVARGELQRLWNAYGARGAASAWYSGNPSLHMSTRAQHGGPSIKAYVDKVVNRAAGLSVGTSMTATPVVAEASSLGPGAPAGTTTGGGGAVPMTRGEQAESYGLSLRLVTSSKELKTLFDKAVKGNWSGARFQAALKNTKWWRTQSSDLRKYITLQHTDPATWKQNRSNAAAAIRSMATQLGVPSLSKSVLNTAVYNKLALGWTDARLKNWLGAKVKAVNGGMGGEAGDVWDTLQELAYSNGYQYSQSWYTKQVRAVMSGKSTLQAVESLMRKQAAARFPAWSAQIKAGANALDLAAPYISSVARLLEIPETDVDLWNKHVAKAMKAKGSNGAQYPLWQLENAVRADPLWRKTNNSRESMMEVGRAVARDFGMAW